MLIKCGDHWRYRERSQPLIVTRDGRFSGAVLGAAAAVHFDQIQKIILHPRSHRRMVEGTTDILLALEHPATIINVFSTNRTLAVATETKPTGEFNRLF